MASQSRALLEERIRQAGATARNLRSGIFHRGSWLVFWLATAAWLVVLAPAGTQLFDLALLPLLPGCAGVLWTVGLIPVGVTALFPSPPRFAYCLLAC